MKNLTSLVYLVALMLLLVQFQSCKKEEPEEVKTDVTDNPNNGNNNNTSTLTQLTTKIDGVLWSADVSSIDCGGTSYFTFSGDRASDTSTLYLYMPGKPALGTHQMSDASGYSGRFKHGNIWYDSDSVSSSVTITKILYNSYNQVSEITGSFTIKQICSITGKTGTLMMTEGVFGYLEKK